jgi:RNA polymerase sigma factor (sigma-70 family)
LVAILARKVGARNIDAVEDAVQNALASAVATWPVKGLPENAGAWLYRVAHNHLIGNLRLSGARRRLMEREGDELAAGPSTNDAPHESRYAAEIADDLLRMLFICCDEEIPADSRLVLALKTLCGFSTQEIAFRLFITDANVHKRLARARDRLRSIIPDLDSPPIETMKSRLPSVRNVLYLLFNEGYLSAQPDQAIRRDLCEEAIRLGTILASHEAGADPETFALLALMNLHGARLDSRTDGVGGLQLLEDQDRSLWDQDRIRIGLAWLNKSASGGVFSRYHAEAAIAAEHCMAPTFAQTRWEKIVELYGILDRIAPSPLHILNQAVAKAEWKGAEAGLELLKGLEPPSWLTGFHLWEAVMGELYRRAGSFKEARHHLELALSSAPTEAEQKLLKSRLASLSPGNL